MNESLIWWVIAACCAGALAGSIGVAVCGLIMDCTGCEREEDDEEDEK